MVSLGFLLSLNYCSVPRGCKNSFAPLLKKNIVLHNNFLNTGLNLVRLTSKYSYIYIPRIAEILLEFYLSARRYVCLNCFRRSILLWCALFRVANVSLQWYIFRDGGGPPVDVHSRLQGYSQGLPLWTVWTQFVTALPCQV